MTRHGKTTRPAEVPPPCPPSSAAWACEAAGKDSDHKHEHTRAWSQTVQVCDGFLFVFPQYNWGYPAVLKNALDYLYQEWHDKPASFITYGTRGGGKAAEQFTGSWQLKDIHATLHPVIPALAAIDFQMTEALDDTQ